MKAARPARIAPALTKDAVAPPVNGTGLDPATVPFPLGEVLLPPLLLFPLVSVKLAQVKRVVLLV